jgi:hypothetical protein
MYANNIQFTKIEIQLLKYIFKHFKDKYNARQLAKLLSLNHANINKLCKSLTNKNLLIKEEMSNSIYYSFNYDNELSIKFIEYLLSLEKDEFPKWLKILIYNLKKFEEFISFGCVFGSSIKNDKFNDIDILLIYNKKMKTKINKIKTIIRKSELIEKPIRYMEISKKDIKKNLNNDVFYKIISENLIFHNSSKYIEIIKQLKNI